MTDLATNDLGIPELLYGRPSFDLLTAIAEQIAAEAPFLDLFWHYRAIHVPILRLLSAPVVEGGLLPRGLHRLRRRWSPRPGATARDGRWR